MPHRETKNISFTPEQVRFIDDRVESGLYQSASEVVRSALRLLEQHELERAAAIANARRMIREGTEQLDRGEALDGPTVMGELRSRLLRKTGGRDQEA